MIRDNCISCGFGIIFKYCTLFGFMSLWPTCQHGERKLKFHNIKSNHIIVVGPILFFVSILSAAVIYTGIRIHDNLRYSKDIEEIMILIPNFILYFMIGFTIVATYFQIKEIQDVCRISQCLVEDFRESTSIVLLTAGELKKAKGLCSVQAILLGGNVIASFILFFDIIKTENYHYLEKIGSLAGECYFCAFVFGFYNFHNVFHILMTKYQNHFKQELIDIIDFSDNSAKRKLNIDNNKLEETNIANSIAIYNILHSKLIFDFRKVIGYFNPFIILMLTSLIFIVAFFIVEDILLITTKNMDKFFSWPIIIANTELILSVLALAGVSWMTAKTDALNNDMLSFLSKYPISKLNREEANQLEAYMKLVRLQKFAVNASDIAFLSLPLYATICGAIITYICTAMQIIGIISK